MLWTPPCLRKYKHPTAVVPNSSARESTFRIPLQQKGTATTSDCSERPHRLFVELVSGWKGDLCLNQLRSASVSGCDVLKRVAGRTTRPNELAQFGMFCACVRSTSGPVAVRVYSYSKLFVSELFHSRRTEQIKSITFPM